MIVEDDLALWEDRGRIFGTYAAVFLSKMKIFLPDISVVLDFGFNESSKLRRFSFSTNLFQYLGGHCLDFHAMIVDFFYLFVYV